MYNSLPIELKYQITKKQLEKIIKEVNMKVSEKEINYIETMCSLLINTLKAFNNEAKKTAMFIQVLIELSSTD